MAAELKILKITASNAGNNATRIEIWLYLWMGQSWLLGQTIMHGKILSSGRTYNMLRYLHPRVYPKLVFTPIESTELAVEVQTEALQYCYDQGFNNIRGWESSIYAIQDGDICYRSQWERLVNWFRSASLLGRPSR